MTEAETYINCHKEIEKCLLIAGQDFDYCDLRTFIDRTLVRTLVLIRMNACEIPDNYMDMLENDGFTDIDIREEKIGSFRGMEGKWALCAVNVDPELIYRLKDTDPEWLLVTILEGYRSAFSLWEAYRNKSAKIIIKTIRQPESDDEEDDEEEEEETDKASDKISYGKPDQVLEWEKSDNDIELSVIMPMYNVAPYLPQCIEGLCAWKADYVEFLFVNDGSPDNSRDIILRYAEKDSRIKLLDKVNGGCASARQYGLERAKGRYIGFVDPDDFVDESMFRKLLRAAMNGSYDIAYCGYKEYYENTKEYGAVEELLGSPYSHGTTDENSIRNLINYTRIAIWRRIVKKELIESAKIHFYTDLRRFDDLPFQIETLANAKSIISVPEPMYFYRLARPGQDVSADDERLYVHFDIFAHLKESIESKKDQRLTDILQTSKIQTHIYALSMIKEQFRDEYMRRAKEDLDSTLDADRTYMIAERRIGHRRAEMYKAIENLDKECFYSLVKAEGGR